MQDRSSTMLQRTVILLTAVLVVKVTIAVVLGFRNYFPPNFNVDFLRGREGYFFGGYQWAFYPHILTGPISLVLGLLLVSDRFRRWCPKWHRRLGRIQAVIVLLFVAPSGLWMAYAAQSGPIAGVGFAVLALLTGGCIALGWKAAVERRFVSHRHWMWRTFLLLCSTVVLRLVGGFATVIGSEMSVSFPIWFDPLTAWGSWFLPLLVYEVTRVKPRRPVRGGAPQRL